MGLAEELYCMMLEVGYTARIHCKKHPELSKFMINSALSCLPIWRKKERTMADFARRMLRWATDLRATTGQLPYPVASACWRLFSLLEYISKVFPEK
jgi:hypothetical protein